MAKKKAKATSKKRHRRTDEELIVDLKKKIKELKQRQESKKLKKRRYLYDRLRLNIFHSIDDIARSRSGAYEFLNDNRNALLIPTHQDVVVADLYDARKLDRAARRLPRQIILVYIWREEVLLDDEVSLIGSRRGQLPG